MKKLVVLLLVFLFGFSVSAQEFSKLDVSPLDIAAFPKSYKNSKKEIKIIYSRPQLKGRSLDSLAPKGKVWRTGANESTELVLYTSFKVGDIMLSPGSYSFFTIPGDKEWTIIINSDVNTWGAYFYNQAHDVARIQVPVTTVDDSVEAFSITFTEDRESGRVLMHLGWGNTRVVIPFEK